MNNTVRNTRPTRGFNFIYIILLLWMILLVGDFIQYSKNIQVIPYSQFLSLLKDKKVDEVVIGEDQIEGTFRGETQGKAKRFSTVRMNDPQLIPKLTQSDVTFQASRPNWAMRALISWVLPALVIVGLWMFILNRVGRTSGNQFLSIGKSKAKVYVEKDLKTRFLDVAGIDEVKGELQEVVQFLKDPRTHSRLGGRMPKGILLIGPPGTGKTLLARAVAGEAGVPFFSINGSEFVELFVGLGAARVRDLFQQARLQAPCIVFIDELDALGKARGLSALSGSANDEKEQTLNQLLAEMDGFDTSQGIILLAATNRPEVLDPALLRAGRFDRQIFVDKPDRKGRVAILSVHMKNIRLSPEVSPDLVASMTAGFSGADLANLVNEATLIATRRGAKAVEPRDFTEAIERVLAGLERKSRLLNPEEKRRVAYHEMGHATVALALGRNETVHKVSVIPRGYGALGYTFRRPTEDRYLMMRTELQDKLAMLLGGRASEMIFFDDISTGAGDDLDKATEIARAMVTRYGMSETLGYATFEKDTSPILGSQGLVKSADYSEKTSQMIDSEIKKIIDRAMNSALFYLHKHRKMVEKGAKFLFEQETLDEDQLKKIWDEEKGRPEEELGRPQLLPNTG